LARRSPEEVHAHDRPAELGLKRNDEDQQRDNGRGIEHPAGDEQIELARDEHGHTKRENTGRQS